MVFLLIVAPAAESGDVSAPAWAGDTEAWANRAFAVSALIAAVMRCWHAGAGEFWLPAVIGVAAINGLVAVLFFARRPVVSLGAPWQLASCLPSMIGSGLALRLAPGLTSWPYFAHGLFAAGALLTLVALAWLGRSFGVMPALRQTVQAGPYALVRHPAYLGELIMTLACFLAGPGWLAASAWVLLVPGVAWRIWAEETLLSADPHYQAYQQQVRSRLIPGVW